MEKKMNVSNIRKIGQELFEAADTKKIIPPFFMQYPDTDLKQAYQIQKVVVEHYLNHGFHISGKKMGYTDPEMQKKMKLDQPSYGFLFAEKRLTSGSKVAFEQFLQPGIEAEILFEVKEDMKGKTFTEEEITDCIASIRPALEVVDRRQVLAGRSQMDSIADNGSFGAYVVGDNRVTEISKEALEKITVEAYRNHTKVAAGTGRNVMYNPLNSLIWAVNALSMTDDYFRKGEALMSGSLIPLQKVEKGDTYTADFGWLGSASITFS